jgi:hypothetical protein
MKWKSLVLLIVLIGFLLLANSLIMHLSPSEMGDLIVLIAVGFYIEQAERRITERLDRIEALIRAKVGDNV